MFRHMKMRLKMGLTVLLLFAGMFAMGGLGLNTLHTNLLEDRKSELKNVVQSAVSIAGGFQARVANKELSQQDAMEAFKQAIRPLRFAGGAGYMFIYDMNGVNQLLPPKPSLEGKNLWDLADANGVKLIQDLARESLKEDGGFVAYVWDKPGEQEGVKFEKISYAAQLPWGHYIGTGLYIDDLDAAFWASGKLFIVLGVVFTLLAVMISTLISKDITAMLLTLRRAMDQITAENLSDGVQGLDRQDELGDMARSVEVFRDQAMQNKELRENADKHERQLIEDRRRQTLEMAEKLESRVKAMVARIGLSIEGLQKTAGDMRQIAETSSERSRNVLTASQETSGNVSTVAAATEELSASALEISGQVTRSSEYADEASRQLDLTNEKVGDLARTVDKIGDILTLITDVTDRTNLLALNATVEAARAGDAGKGFAVVASEVRNLANQTALATSEIDRQISAVQEESDHAISAVKGINATLKGVVENTTVIAAAVEEQNASIQEISRSVAQASSGSSEISETIGGLSDDVSQTLGATTTVAEAAQELVKESQELGKQVDAFLTELRRQD